MDGYLLSLVTPESILCYMKIWLTIAALSWSVAIPLLRHLSKMGDLRRHGLDRYVEKKIDSLKINTMGFTTGEAYAVGALVATLDLLSLSWLIYIIAID